MTRRSQHYPPELRERAVRMVAEVTPNYDSQWAAMGAVAQKLGIGTAETVRKWVRQAETDTGQRPGTTTEESAELRRLKRENAELRRANEILKAASAFFAAELDRPSTRSTPAAVDLHIVGNHGRRERVLVGVKSLGHVGAPPLVDDEDTVVLVLDDLVTERTLASPLAGDRLNDLDVVVVHQPEPLDPRARKLDDDAHARPPTAET